jgi:hypothetical protein
VGLVPAHPHPNKRFHGSTSSHSDRIFCELTRQNFVSSQIRAKISP